MMHADSGLEQSGSFGWVWLVAVLGAALIGAVGNWAVARMRTSPAPVQLPSGDVLDARDSSNIARMIADLYGKVANLEEQNGALTESQGALVGHVDTLRKGVTNGSIPPLPPMPERIAHLFNAPTDDDT